MGQENICVASAVEGVACTLTEFQPPITVPVAAGWHYFPAPSDVEGMVEFLTTRPGMTMSDPVDVEEAERPLVIVFEDAVDPFEETAVGDEMLAGLQIGDG